MSGEKLRIQRLEQVADDQLKDLQKCRLEFDAFLAMAADLRGLLLPHVPCYCPVNRPKEVHPYCSRHRVEHVLDRFEINIGIKEK